MQIFVRGLSEAPVALTLSNNSSVADLKRSIEDQFFLPVEHQRLVHSSTSTAITCISELVEDDEIVLEVPIDAGMRAKWRKKRMRRLRRKRRKMRMRAR